MLERSAVGRTVAACSSDPASCKSDQDANCGGDKKNTTSLISTIYP